MSLHNLIRELEQETRLFVPVVNAIGNAHLVAYDGCHKIYLAMDEIEADWFRENYEFIVEATPDEMLAAVADWWDASCGLRFVSAVTHNEENPNDGFVSLISQFADIDIDIDIDE